MTNRLGYALRVLIAEDEAPARAKLREYIQRYAELEITGVAVNGEETFSLMRSGKFDLVFLDMKMPLVSGLEILNRLSQAKTKMPKIIFTTAFGDFALDAFVHGAVDFLLKPFSFQRFQQVMERMFSFPIVEDEQKQKKNKFVFQGRDLHIIVPWQDILYFEAAEKKTLLQTYHESIEIPLFLGYVESRLPETKFMRVHKQYIANLGRIWKLEHVQNGRYAAYIGPAHNRNIPVGRKYAPLLKKNLHRLLS